MNNLDSASRWLLLFSASLAGIFSGQLITAFTEAIGVKASYALVFVLLIVFLRTIQVLIENLSRNSKIFRKWVLGKSYIEGYWVDKSYDTFGNLVGVACFYVEYADNSLLLSGSTLKASNNLYGAWDTKFGTLKGRTLAYAFESHTSNADSPVEYGYAELKLSRGYSAPLSYSGFFFDTSNKSLITLQGNRIVDKQTIRLLEDPESRYQYLKKQLDNERMRKIE